MDRQRDSGFGRQRETLSTDLPCLGSREAASCDELSAWTTSCLPERSVAQRFDDRDLGRMRRDGTLIPVRRGAYVHERPAERTLAEEHRELILATAPQLHDGAVISHASAAVLHGLPAWQSAMDRVHLTRNRSSGGNRRSVVQVHTAALAHDHITTIDGIPVTSLARTVLDLCRTVPIEQAVAAGDRALAYGWYARFWTITSPR